MNFWATFCLFLLCVDFCCFATDPNISASQIASRVSSSSRRGSLSSVSTSRRGSLSDTTPRAPYGTPVHSYMDDVKLNPKTLTTAFSITSLQRKLQNLQSVKIEHDSKKDPVVDDAKSFGMVTPPRAPQLTAEQAQLVDDLFVLEI